ncbi:MAG: DUF4430 domain-containing protein [Cyclobacteriaceae bacterium]
MNRNIFFFLFLITFSCSSPTKKEESTSGSKKQFKKERGDVALNFNFGDETIAFERVPWRSGLNLYDILMQQEADEITFEVQDTLYGDLGHLILGFNGIKNNGKENWVFCLNGKKSNRGVDQVDLKSGDIVDWYYVNGTSSTPCEQNDLEL